MTQQHEHEHEQQPRRRSTSRSTSTRLPPIPDATSSDGPLRTSVGSLGITVRLDPMGRVFRDANGLLFRRDLRDLCCTYLYEIHLTWEQFDENKKKYVLAALRDRYGPEYCEQHVITEMVHLMKSRRDKGRQCARKQSNTRPIKMAKESWTHFRREVRQNKTWSKMKAARAIGLSRGHTSRLGSGGYAGLRALFAKDYGRECTPQEAHTALYGSYSSLQRVMPPPAHEELHGDVDEETVEREMAEAAPPPQPLPETTQATPL